MERDFKKVKCLVKQVAAALGFGDWNLLWGEVGDF